MEILYFDVITIGAGGGGCIAAITASEQGAKVALISKGLIGYGNTRIAGGNIASVGFQKGDNPDIFLQNILESGEFIGQRSVIKEIAQEAIKIPEILENFGLIFKRNQEGIFDDSAICRRGGHSHSRSLSTSSKGIGFGNVLEMAIARSNLTIFEEMIAIKLISNHEYISGVICFDLRNNKIIYLSCKAIILATGGASWIYYPHTTNTKEATGDGYSLAISAGAELMNMEMVQFQPFGLAYPPHLVGLPCGEPAHAGPFGRLLAGDKKTVILEKLNRMTRAQVSKEVAMAIKKGFGTVNDGLLLDLSGNLSMSDKNQYLGMLGGPGGILYRVKFALGEKAAKLEEPWEIAPTAHFFMGGVVTDNSGLTNIKGLYCIGEVNGTVHGANRLGTVALTEVFIMGIKSGLMAAEEEQKKSFSNIEPKKKNMIIKELNKELFLKVDSNGKYHPINLIRQVQKIVWDHAGPVKSQEDITLGIKKLYEIKDLSQNIKISMNTNYNTEIRDLIELDGMIKVAEMIMQSALIRKESRGAHIRSDFPDKWASSYCTIVWYKDNQLKVKIRRI